MPRRSPEDRAAAHWRAGAKPPPAPAMLSNKAKVLWRRITGSRPFDYFDEAAQVLLAQFCELSITQQINLEMVRFDPKDLKWQTAAAKMQQVINSTAVKLRISPSTVLSKKRGILSEREIDTDGESNVLLFGGPGPPRF
jgi:hypothetical protein